MTAPSGRGRRKHITLHSGAKPFLLMLHIVSCKQLSQSRVGQYGDMKKC